VEEAGGFAEGAGSSVETRRLAYIPEYRVYNREREIERQERERKEKQWEEELNTAMRSAEEALRYESNSWRLAAIQSDPSSQGNLPRKGIYEIRELETTLLFNPLLIFDQTGQSLPMFSSSFSLFSNLSQLSKFTTSLAATLTSGGDIFLRQMSLVDRFDQCDSQSLSNAIDEIYRRIILARWMRSSKESLFD